jgi:hypothetical protein
MRAVIDEEVQGLSEIHRGVFLLCCCEGLSFAQTAQRPGLKEGTVCSRLAMARQRLRERLARRGVALSTLPVGVLTAPVPTRLVDLALSATMSDTPGGLSATVLTLAEGAMPPMISSRFRHVLMVCLALTLAGVSALPGRSARTDSPKPKKTTTTPSTSSASISLDGKVLGADGKPIRGARVRLYHPDGDDKAPAIETTTDARGAFHLEAPARAQERGQLIVQAAGHALNWQSLSALSAGQDIVLRLPAEGPPIEGRLIDLEGQPIPDVPILLIAVGECPEKEKLEDWIKVNIKESTRGRYLNTSGLRWIRWRAIGPPPAIKTDKQGRFRLPSIGRDRIVTVNLLGETTEHQQIRIVGRKMRPSTIIPGHLGLYASGFECALAPCKPIVGVVRDNKTKKPLANILVADSFRPTAETRTDEKGRYRLVGAAKRKVYSVTAGGGPGRPYFDRSINNIADTPGFEPINVDIEMARGIEVSGKVTESKTGQPVRGEVWYHWVRRNPHANEIAGFLGSRIISDWGRINPDGSYRVLTIPGEGVLLVLGQPVDRYARIDAQQEMYERKVYSWPAQTAHSVTAIDVKGDKLSSQVVPLTVTMGVSRTVVANRRREPSRRQASEQCSRRWQQRGGLSAQTARRSAHGHRSARQTSTCAGLPRRDRETRSDCRPPGRPRYAGDGQVGAAGDDHRSACR